MRERSGLTVFLVTTWLSGLSCGSEPPHHEDFEIGMSRETIMARFGEPARTQELSKSDEAIWGPIEDFWARVPLGATVEIWAFPSTMRLESPQGATAQPGQTELYFVNHSETVDGIGFYIEGAVYEGQ